MNRKISKNEKAVADKIARRRSKGFRITEETRMSIIRDYGSQENASCRSLGARYGLSPTTVGRILRAAAKMAGVAAVVALCMFDGWGCGAQTDGPETLGWCCSTQEGTDLCGVQLVSDMKDATCSCAGIVHGEECLHDPNP